MAERTAVHVAVFGWVVHFRVEPTHDLGRWSTPLEREVIFAGGNHVPTRECHDNADCYHGAHRTAIKARQDARRQHDARDQREVRPPKLALTYREEGDEKERAGAKDLQEPRLR
jgi:hypothetical protein